jgi:uncharacterized membrane protein
MAFCPNCGAEAPGKFCPKCGAAVGAAGGATYAPPAGTTGGQASGLTENVACMLCYLFGWVTGVIFLVMAPYNTNRLIRFHAFQSIFLSVGIFAVYFGLMIVFGILHAIIPGFALLGLMLYPLLSLCILGVTIFLMYKAYNNEKFVLPILGPLAETQANK